MKNYQNLVVGILGGGQLGRMMIQSAIDLHLNIRIMDPDPNAPCKDLVSDFVVNPLTDFDAVIEFGRACDVITIEIENVAANAVRWYIMNKF